MHNTATSTTRAWTDDSPADVGDVEALQDITRLLRDAVRLDLSAYKIRPLLWRIRQRMREHGCERLSDYVTFLRDEPAEIDALVCAIPIHVTEFFRDPEAWEMLRREVIAPLFDEVSAVTEIRTWTPACASGQEAYSLAMLLWENASTVGRRMKFTAFATDLSASIVTQAGHGSFTRKQLEGVSEERLERFFQGDADSERVQRSLRQQMVFAQHDLIADPPLPHMAIVTCRNLLFYLEREARERVIGQLHASLEPGGYLLVGAGESLSEGQTGFETTSKEWGIYRKTGPIGRPQQTTAVILQSSRAAYCCATCEATTRALRLSRDELETSREELKAVNEELQASNEELISTTRELSEVNAELRLNVEELNMQRRMLNASSIITLVLDADLRVRWFSPAVSLLFPLLPADLNRPITDLRPRFHDPDFLDDVQRVLQTGEPVGADVQTHDHRWFSRWIGPFRDGDMDPTGVTITFAGITGR